MVLIMIVIWSGLSLLFQGCKEDPKPSGGDGLEITGVSIPSVIDVPAKGNITITGKGFAVNDEIRLTQVSDPSKVYVTRITTVTANDATFVLPDQLPTGSYKITVTRGQDSMLLGALNINIVANSNIPDVAGMTVKGVVSCNGEAVPGVVVSDGIDVTTTDSKGIYYLASQKKTGFVFISVPGNYEVASDNRIPLFFKRLSGGTTVEQKDFSLVRTDNKKHVVVAMTDFHLANRNDDLAQYTNGFVPDVNNTIQSYESGGTKVYGVTMGDLTWDAYWYENNFGIQEYLPQMARINCSIFNAMGNHDNDPYVAGDWLAETKYKNFIGPTWYSFNLGDVHYVVLDNVEYTNAGGAQGVMGDREYNDVISSDQMAWLQKDLATIKDKSTPVILVMHIQLYSNPGLDGSGNQVSSITLNNGNQLLSLLQGFSEVHILTGHTHINYAVEANASVMEHNTAAVCATWWWTGRSGYAGNHICKDGSPGGYGVWEINGKEIRWYYKSIGSPKNYQFRSYDLNKVLITASAFAPNAPETAMAEYAGVYSSPGAGNEILINVWGYDPKWKIEVREAGKSLPVSRVSVKDPLHIISYEAKRLNVGAVPTSSFVTGNTAHMFKAKASSASSALEITVTDRFGNIYSETMARPKEFTTSIK